jgi:hypothetical protein
MARSRDRRTSARRGGNDGELRPHEGPVTKHPDLLNIAGPVKRGRLVSALCARSSGKAGLSHHGLARHKEHDVIGHQGKHRVNVPGLRGPDPGRYEFTNFFLIVLTGHCAERLCSQSDPSQRLDWLTFNLKRCPAPGIFRVGAGGRTACPDQDRLFVVRFPPGKQESSSSSLDLVNHRIFRRQRRPPPCELRRHIACVIILSLAWRRADRFKHAYTGKLEEEYPCDIP